MTFNEAIKFIPRTNSFKLGDAVKRLTSSKPNILMKPDEKKRKRVLKRQNSVDGTVTKLYGQER